MTRKGRGTRTTEIVRGGDDFEEDMTDMLAETRADVIEIPDSEEADDTGADGTEDVDMSEESMEDVDMSEESSEDVDVGEESSEW